MAEDLHVHSTFSDGTTTIAENVAEAERLGLSELGCVDHVRTTTDWVPAYVAAVRAASKHTEVRLRCAIEAKILDTTGALDLPGDVDGVDAIYVADHQVASRDGPLHPDGVRAALADGSLDPAEVISDVVASTVEAVGRYEHVLIAHLFSVLPKVGLDEKDVPLDEIAALAEITAAAGAEIEISERWRCPSARTLREFRARSVPIRLSTDSHNRETIGRYEYCARVMLELERG